MEDLSDLEREEQLRSFWRDNWLTLVGGIAIGLGAIAGWRYWQAHTRERAESAEAAYSAVLDALTASKRDDAASRAAELRKANPSSPYADQADLALARAAVETRDYDEAARRLDAVIDGYYPVIEGVGNVIEALEEEVLGRPTRATLRRIHAVRRSLVALHRMQWRQRDACGALLRDVEGPITEPVRVYLRDAFDHAFQTVDALETQRELASTLMELYLSSASNRMVIRSPCVVGRLAERK